MTDRKLHRERVPEPLDVLLGRLGELRVMFGAAGTAAIAAVEDDLRGAVAARDRGDPQGSIERISRGMQRLAALADSLDSETGPAMRMMIDRFRVALLQGHEGDARRAADVMRKQAGAKIIGDGE